MSWLKWIENVKGCGGRRRIRIRNLANHSNILSLPRNVFFLITDQLELHDLFILSQSNPVLRSFTYRHWATEVSTLPKSQQLEFWTGLAYTLPNHWVCDVCCCLHRLPESHLSHKRLLPGCSHEQGRGLGRVYDIHHSRIHIVLKHQMRGSPYGKRFVEIMVPYSWSDSWGSSRRTYEAAPRIVDGRFFLYMDWKLTSCDFQSTFFVYGLAANKLCPHIDALSIYQNDIRPSMDIRSHWSRAISNEIASSDQSATAASSNSAVTFSGSCSRCPTDYFVTVDDDDDKLRLQLWQDFGPYASPENLDWRVHVRTDRNNEAGGPSLYHVPGLVREAYESFDATDTKC